jgi:hypothetical protein
VPALHGPYHLHKEKKMDPSANQASRSARRVAARQARDTFPPMGIYAIRVRTSGHLLLGVSRNVHAALNRARFELRMGKHADREDEGFDYAGELKALEQIHRELQGLAP